MLYNKSVNIGHGLSQMKSEFADIQSKNLAIKSRIFDLINSPDAPQLGNLVQEKNPEYIDTRTSWSFASDY